MEKNIVFLINTLKVGGAAKMLKYVANISSELFDSVTIVSLYDDYYRPSDLNNNIQVECLGFEKVGRVRRQLIMVPKVRNAIKRLKPSYVCSFISHVCVIGRVATWKNKNIIYMSAERGDPYTEPFLWKLLDKWAFTHSDYCFFQLDMAKNFFGPQINEKSFVIPNPAVFNYLIEPYFGKRKPTIVSAGRFGKEKRYCDLIDAFSLVRKKYHNYTLTIYGDGPLRESYLKQIKKLGIEDCVSFPGYVDCFAQRIREDGIFVLSSLYEGIPNSLIEAMSVGIPCVATNCTPGGPAFLFNDEVRGILVPVRDPRAIADAIIQYIENPKLALQKGKAAVGIIEQLAECTIRNMWLGAFRKIINHES